ncbi:MAG: ATP-binding protein [Spirochaetes bacterium]|nr:ATP-binding protein [Spirochaetota bacterium]
MNSKIPRDLFLKLPGTVDYIDQIREFIEKNARKSGLNDEDVDAVVLSIDEAVANIIEHSYEGRHISKKDRLISIYIRVDDSSFTIKLTDNGRFFDPTTADSVDIDNHLNQYKTNGLGIHFMRQLMDEIRYSHSKKDGNVLELVKYIK